MGAAAFNWNSGKFETDAGNKGNGAFSKAAVGGRN